MNLDEKLRHGRTQPTRRYSEIRGWPNLRDLATLVVASQDSYSVFVANFQCDEKSDGFHGIITTIHVVTHKQVIRIGTLSAWKSMKLVSQMD